MRKVRPADNMMAGTKHVMNDGCELVIERYNRATDVDVLFTATGYKTKAQASHIRIGSVTDKLNPRVKGVGFIGDGEFQPSHKGKNTLAYSRWNLMLERCYSEAYQENKPTYKGCTVCPEWHNFQNFARWFYENYPKDGNEYHLDKDMIVKGNKVYGPDACCFLTLSENNAVAQRKVYTFINPEGEKVEVENLKKYCLENGINRSGMSMLACGGLKSYKGWTLPQ
jgi:hypothetical protein